MSKSRFLEGMIIGSVIGILGYIFFKENDIKINNEQVEPKEASSMNKQEPSAQAAKQKSEVTVSKTLEAIEKGFDKITKIIDDRKIKEKK